MQEGLAGGTWLSESLGIFPLLTDAISEQNEEGLGSSILWCRLDTILAPCFKLVSSKITGRLLSCRAAGEAGEN